MMRLSRLLLLLIIISTQACALFAQKTPHVIVDSLLIEVKRSQSDEEKLKILTELINVYNDVDGQEGLKYEKEALDLARKLQTNLGEAEVLNVVGRIYWREGNFEKAFEYHDAARKILEDPKYEKQLASTLRNIGQDFLLIQDHSNAIRNFTRALDIYKAKEDLNNQGFIYNLLAYTYAEMGNFSESSRYDYLGLKVYEEAGNEVGMAHMIAGIAENALYLGNYADALEKFARSTEIFRKDNDLINVGATSNLMGRVSRLMHNYDDAIEYHEQALEIGEMTKNLHMKGTAHAGIGDVFSEQGKYQEAIEHYLISIKYHEEWSIMASLADTYRKVSQAYRHAKLFDEAQTYLGKAFDKARKFGNNKHMAECYHEAELLDSALGNWLGAYENHQQYITYRDSVYSQETTSQLVWLEKQYEFDKQQEAELAAQERKDLQTRIQIIFLVIIIALVLTLAYVQYRNQRVLSSVNSDLKNKSDSLEREMSEKSGIMHVVTHDLKSPLNKIDGLTTLLEDTMDKNNEVQQEYLSYIRTSIKQGNHLIKNLLDSELVSSRSTKPNYELVDLSNCLNEYAVSANAQLKAKQQHLVLDLSLGSTHYEVDQQMFTRVLDNLVSNASKFSEKGKTIFIRAWNQNGTLKFSVRDEGPGISEADQKKMFTKFQMLSARPTDGEPSAGLGLSIVKSIIEKLNGTISVSSELDVGTEFVVTLPTDQAAS